MRLGEVGPGRAGHTPAEAVHAVFASLSQHYDPERTKFVVFLADGDEDGLRRQLRETRQKLASQGSTSAPFTSRPADSYPAPATRIG